MRRLLFLSFCCWVCSLGLAWGQGLTSAQLSTLKNDILVTHGSQFTTEIAEKNYPAIATWYNAATSPVVNIWRPDVLVKELNTGIVWADFKALDDASRSTYLAMTQAGFIDTTAQTVRTGFSDIFGNGSATATNLLAIVKRVGTNAEILFAGSNVQGGRVTQIYNYKLSPVDIKTAMDLP